MTECSCVSKTSPYCDVCIPVNPTLEDKSVCHKCENDTFYLLDGNRIFCSKCGIEGKNNVNFKRGRLMVGKHPALEAK